MKYTQNQDHAPAVPLSLKPVIFEFTHSTATTVSVAGTFNDWQPVKSRHARENGRWLHELALAPGTYEYCLVVDGQWMRDPRATASVPNPFGGRNSILEVAPSPEATHLTDAEVLPLKNANQQKTNSI